MRTVLVVIGALLLLGAFIFLVGGTGIFLINDALTSRDRFATGRLHTDSYAMVVEHVEINLGEVGGFRPPPIEVATIRLSAINNNSSKRVFVGIAEESKVIDYLGLVEYDAFTNLRTTGDPFQSLNLTVEHTHHPGDAPSGPPTSQGFWIVNTMGSGTQTLEWSLRTGVYWIVFMNEDGSRGVDLTVGVGAEVPILSAIALGFLSVGCFMLIVGVVLIILGVRRPSQPSAVSRVQQPLPGRVIYCSRCGTPNPEDSRFCRGCGAEIKT